MTRNLTPAIVIVLAIALIISGYAYSRFKNFLAGPRIIVTEPADGATVDDSLLAIKGQVERIDRLTFNGQQIFTDSAGHFEETLLLAYGYNIIEVAATDRFGRGDKKVWQLVLK